MIKSAIKKYNFNRYTKKFSTLDHLISMLFSAFSHCTSLREVAAGMLGLKEKTMLNHHSMNWHLKKKNWEKLSIALEEAILIGEL